MTRLEDLRGIGRAAAGMLREADIATVEELRELGAVEAYRRVRFVRPGVSLNLLHALHAGLDDRDWRALAVREKAALRRALDG